MKSHVIQQLRNQLELAKSQGLISTYNFSPYQQYLYIYLNHNTPPQVKDNLRNYFEKTHNAPASIFADILRVDIAYREVL